MLNKIFMWTALLLIVGLTPAGAADYSGEWIGSVTESTTHCENIGKDLLGEYHLSVSQEGNTLIIQGQRDHVRYVGTMNPGSPGKAHLQAAYNKDGGYVIELADVEFTGPDTGRGGIVWRWSDGLHQCGGSFLFSLAKQ